MQSAIIRMRKNPVTARAALTTLDIIADEGLVERSRELGEFALNNLMEFGNNSLHIGDVRGRGLMFGVEIVKDKESNETNPEMAERIYYRCLERGLSFKISAGNVLTLSPPLTISKSDLEIALDVVKSAIQEEELAA